MSKKIAIMQPYFIPYIGYFQLINSVDEFVIYDNIKYTKKGWINRNRIFFNGVDRMITLPLKKDSDYLNVDQRELSQNWEVFRNDIKNIINISYSKSPFYKQGKIILDEILKLESENLFLFIYESLKILNSYLEISTPIIVSSSIDIDHKLKSQDKVIAICKKLNASKYINAIGGTDLYSKEEFAKNSIELNFIKMKSFIYNQFDYNFIPYLSIIDVIMFNSLEDIKKQLNEYVLI
jgi:hypothetical protein